MYDVSDDQASAALFRHLGENQFLVVCGASSRTIVAPTARAAAIEFYKKCPKLQNRGVVVFRIIPQFGVAMGGLKFSYVPPTIPEPSVKVGWDE